VELVSALSDDSVQLVPIVRLAVLRQLCSPVAMSGQPVTPDEALTVWDVLAQDPRCGSRAVTEIPDERIPRECVLGRAPSPNLWADAWLAALARTLDQDVVTFDRGFRRFPNLQLILLSA
jgi:predicted nucleic acid-binding protein